MSRETRKPSRKRDARSAVCLANSTKISAAGKRIELWRWRWLHADHIFRWSLCPIFIFYFFFSSTMDRKGGKLEIITNLRSVPTGGSDNPVFIHSTSPSRICICHDAVPASKTKNICDEIVHVLLILIPRSIQQAMTTNKFVRGYSREN